MEFLERMENVISILSRFPYAFNVDMRGMHIKCIWKSRNSICSYKLYIERKIVCKGEVDEVWCTKSASQKSACLIEPCAFIR